MNKLIATLLTGATALATTVSLTPSTSSATPAPAIAYWHEATAGLGVSGTYRTVVGDFGGGPEDDIVWNTNSSATDHLWTSNGDTTFTKQALALQPPVGAIPLVGDFLGDAHDDIFWYGPGSAPDAMWMSSGGSFRAAPGRVTGTYEAKVLDDRTGKDGIVFYPAATGRGSIWSFGEGGAFVSRAFTAPAGGTVLTGRFSNDGCADVYVYAQTMHDPLWELDCDGNVARTDEQYLVGDATPFVAQFSPGRDAQDDILWVDPTGRKSFLEENLTDGRFAVSWPAVPHTGTLLRTGNGYATIHQWDRTSGRHHIWFEVPGGLSFNADLTNTAMSSRYQPIVGAFVGTGEDILWYQAGSGAERLFWLAG